MNPASVLNQKLVMRPVFVAMSHLHEFMGPCRYGAGVELSYEYDQEVNRKNIAQFNSDIEKYVDHNLVEVLDTKVVEWHEDFAIPDDALDEATEGNDKIDCYLMCGTKLISYMSTIIAKRTGKPLMFVPLSNGFQSRLGGIDATAHMRALGFNEMYNALSFDDLNRMLRLLRTRKALAKTKLLYAPRNSLLSFGVVSSFIDLQDITDRFGMEIRMCNGLEFFDDLDAMSEEDEERAKRIAEELVRDAHGMHMPAENVVNDTRFYVVVSNALKHFGCNAFTIPCFEMCATRQLNRRKFTFCLSNTLMKDEGIPAACAADVGSVVSLDILMNLTWKSPHMGNCMVMLEGIDRGQMRILHDACPKFMKGYDAEPLTADYVSFTKGNWGTTLRYDFSQDNGDTMTMINMSPRMDKMMIALGTINGCDDFLTQECRHAVEFTVKDARDFHEKQADFGHHFAWVYGDHSKDLTDFCKIMGIEPVLA